MASKLYRLKLGSISHGTMRPRDLLPALIDASKTVRLSDQDRRSVQEIERDFRSWWEIEDWTNNQTHHAEMVIEQLFDTLDNYVPAYTYLGSHEGDGSDYGVWIDWPAIEDSIHDGDINKGPHYINAKYSKAPYWLQVNDHGNSTLFRKIQRGSGWVWHEEWSVV